MWKSRRNEPNSGPQESSHHSNPKSSFNKTSSEHKIKGLFSWIRPRLLTRGPKSSSSRATNFPLIGVAGSKSGPSTYSTRRVGDTSHPKGLGTKVMHSTAYQELKAEIEIVRGGAAAFPPLQAVVDGLLKIINVLETSFQNEQYQAMMVQRLEAVVNLLKEKSNSLSPSIGNHVESLKEALDEQIGLTKEHMERARFKRVMEGERDASEIAALYTTLLRDFAVFLIDARAGIKVTIDEIRKDLLFDKLPQAMAVAYDSRPKVPRNGFTFGTREKILDKLVSWATDGSNKQIYLLNGMAGTGKTTIAYSFCEKLKERALLGASFFCSPTEDESSDTEGILPTIAYELSQHLPEISCIKLLESIREDHDVGSKSLEQQFEKLIDEPIREIPSEFWSSFAMVVVLDALDECKNQREVATLLTLLSWNAANLPIKFFITSRLTPEIEDVFRHQTEILSKFILHDVEEDMVEVDIWDACESILEGHSGLVLSVAFSHDGKRVVSGSFDGTIRIWNVETGEEERKFEGHSEGVLSVAFSYDGKRVFSGSRDRTIRTWNAETGEEERKFEGHPDGVVSMAFTDDGKRVVSGSYDRKIRLWNVETGEERKFEGHSGLVLSVAFSHDGKRIVSGSFDRTIRLWNVETGEEKKFEGHSGLVQSVVFSHDGKRIVSGSQDRTIRIWNVETGEEEKKFEGHSEGVLSVAFSHDGKRVFSGSRDRTIRTWNVETGEEWKFEGHSDWVESVACSHDGKRVVSGSEDMTIRIWNVETGKERKLLGHSERALSVGPHDATFSPNRGAGASKSANIVSIDLPLSPHQSVLPPKPAQSTISPSPLSLPSLLSCPGPPQSLPSSPSLQFDHLIQAVPESSHENGNISTKVFLATKALEHVLKQWKNIVRILRQGGVFEEDFTVMVGFLDDTVILTEAIFLYSRCPMSLDDSQVLCEVFSPFPYIIARIPSYNHHTLSSVEAQLGNSDMQVLSDSGIGSSSVMVNGSQSGNVGNGEGTSSTGQGLHPNGNGRDNHLGNGNMPENGRTADASTTSSEEIRKGWFTSMVHCRWARNTGWLRPQSSTASNKNRIQDLLTRVKLDRKIEGTMVSPSIAHLDIDLPPSERGPRFALDNFQITMNPGQGEFFVFKHSPAGSSPGAENGRKSTQGSEISGQLQVSPVPNVTAGVKRTHQSEMTVPNIQYSCHVTDYPQASVKWTYEVNDERWRKKGLSLDRGKSSEKELLPCATFGPDSGAGSPTSSISLTVECFYEATHDFFSIQRPNIYWKNIVHKMEINQLTSYDADKVARLAPLDLQMSNSPGPGTQPIVTFLNTGGSGLQELRVAASVSRQPTPSSSSSLLEDRTQANGAVTQASED